MTTTSIDQLTTLLDRYFVGPIARSTVEKIHAERAALESNESRKTGEENALRANGKRYFGQLWREDLPEIADPLAVWIAASRGGGLTPRPYCPSTLVGSWSQSTPTAAAWTFVADGTMTTTDPSVARSTRWCVHRSTDEGGDDELRVSEADSSDHEAFFIATASANEIAMTWVSPGADVPYKLRRA